VYDDETVAETLARLERESSRPRPTPGVTTGSVHPHAPIPGGGSPPLRQNGWLWTGTKWVPDPAWVKVQRGGEPVVYSDPAPRVSSPALLVVAWLVALLTGLYMLPWAIAVSRGLPTHPAIGWVNLLLGWTVVGWVIAFLMALGRPREL
jgi:hypothetical protein